MSYIPPHLRKHAQPQVRAQFTYAPSSLAPSNSTAQAGPSCTSTFTPSPSKSTPSLSIVAPMDTRSSPSHLDLRSQRFSLSSNLSSSTHGNLPTHSNHKSNSNSDIPPEQAQAQEDLQMELLGTLSRSGTRSGLGGTGVGEGDALKDWDVQRRYGEYIERKLDAFHLKYTRWPMSTSAEAQEDITSILLLFRKLREGIVAIDRADEFALSIYEQSTTYAILSRNHPQIASSLISLVPKLYVQSDRLRSQTRNQDDENLDRDVKNLGSSSVSILREDEEIRGLTAGLQGVSIRKENTRDSARPKNISSDINQTTKLNPTSSIDLDHRAFFSASLLTYLICHQDDRVGWWKLWFELTLVKRSKSIGRRRSERGWSSDQAKRSTEEEGVEIGKQRDDRSGPKSAFVDPQHPYMVYAKRIFEAYTSPSPILFATLMRHPPPVPSRSSTSPNHRSNRERDLLVHLPRAIMLFGLERLRQRSWMTVKTAYRDLGAGWAGRLLMMGDTTMMEAKVGNKTEQVDEWEDGRMLTELQEFTREWGGRLDGTKVIIKG